MHCRYWTPSLLLYWRLFIYCFNGTPFHDWKSVWRIY